ncbi:MAG: hypothetical protein HHJ17_02870 [Rhodoferax sp.]|uniref:hypothetical protein n=1 Tax=Rhodoferax sp. TaxID=50421 RepID=UPI0017FE5A2D|nr:hypothetical protein [Rhodoferax sp.]NMM12473.1 hypothetical protein [Rhodoferax sp.]
MKRFNLKAVAIGTLTMLALDLLTGVVSFIVFSGDSLTSGATQSEITAAGKIIEQNDGYLLFGLLLGSLSTVIGGYIAARIARNLPLFNAFAVGVVGIAAGILLGGQSESPEWFNAVGYISTIPAAIAGGWLARNTMKQGA